MTVSDDNVDMNSGARQRREAWAAMPSITKSAYQANVRRYDAVWLARHSA